MKKFILLIILMIPFSVNGETFYSKYYIKEKDTTVYRDETDYLNREERKIYNNYNYIRINENYYPIYHNPSSSPILDINDEIWSTWSVQSKLSNSEGPFTKFWVRNLKNVRYLMFRSFQASKATFDSLIIYSKGEVIPFTYYKTNFKMGSQMTTSTEFIIDLNKLYNIYDLSIETNFTDPSYSRIAYMIKAFSEYIPDPTKFESFSNEVIRGKAQEKYIVTFENEENFQNFIRTETEWIHAKDYMFTHEVNFYKYPMKKYKYYNLIKNYSNKYTDIPLDGYKLDYSDYKYLYTYYERFKVDIKDEINNENDINNLIIDSNYPKDNINIISNIDLNTNGNYLIHVKFLDEDFTKNIKVNINKPTTTSQTKTYKYNKKTNYFNNKIISTSSTTTKKEIIIKNLNNKSKLNNYKRKKNNIDYYLIILILLIFATILLIIRKKKN